jgi:mono/diheme cytochrome c family protein
LPPWWLSA